MFPGNAEADPRRRRHPRPTAEIADQPPFDMYEAADDEEEEDDVDDDEEVEEAEGLSSLSTPTLRLTKANSSNNNDRVSPQPAVVAEGVDQLEEEEEEVEGPSADVLCKLMNKRNGRAEKRYHTAPVESKRGRPRDNSIHKRYSWHVGQQQQQQSPQVVCNCEASQRQLPITSTSQQQQQQHQQQLPKQLPGGSGSGGAVVSCTCGVGVSNSAPVSTAVSNMSIGSSSGVSSSCSVLISYESSDYAESIPEVDSDSGALEEEEEEEYEEEEEEDDGREGQTGYELPYYRRNIVEGGSKTTTNKIRSASRKLTSASSTSSSASGTIIVDGCGSRSSKIASSNRSSSQESEEPDLVVSGSLRRPRSSGLQHAVDSDASAASSSSATPTPTDAETASLHSSSGGGRGGSVSSAPSLERENSMTSSKKDVDSTPMPESLVGSANSFHRKMTPAERLRVKKLVLLNPTLEAS